MYILGINFTTHDAAVSLVKDGEIIYAAEAERFNREKHTKKFPKEAIEDCFKTCCITMNQIDEIAVFVEPKLYKRLFFYNSFSQFPKSILYIPYTIKWIKRRKEIYRQIYSYFGEKFKNKVHYVNHHLAHAASSYYASGYASAIIVTLDGRGEYETIGIYKGEGTKIIKLYSYKYPHSIGYMYTALTKFLGFKPKHDEYKVMGLASYGRPNQDTDNKISKLFSLKNNKFRLNLDFFDHHYKFGKRRMLYSKKFQKTFGSPRYKNNLGQDDADLAYSLQKHLNLIVLEILKDVRNKHKTVKNLCLAGGVALNCSMNTAIAESQLFDNIFINPAANDAGTSLGAALYCFYLKSPNTPTVKLKNAYLGRDTDTDADIQARISKYKDISYYYQKDVCECAAQRISKGNVIGWYQGRMEFGPRALGNRSILADPRHSGMKDLINKKIKFREEFRPFAPSVLYEDVSEFFQVQNCAFSLYKYMLSTVKANPSIISQIPAVVHVDGTSRIQTVSEGDNEKYYNLIKCFKQITGIPILLNTSFNIKGQPIVCSVEEAVASFLESDLDYLYIGSYEIVKNRGEKL